MLYPAQFEETFVEHEQAEDGYGYVTYKCPQGITVTFRDVPEAITQGANFADAVEMAQDALRTAMEFYDERGEDYPKPSEPQQGDVMINL